MDQFETVMITDIVTNGGTQCRVELDQKVIAEYADNIDELPPIDVFCDGAKYWLIDGFHRFFAHKRLKHLEIKCRVRQGDQRDAILASLSANSTHGLKRKNEDKRKAVETLLKDPEWKIWPNRKIAKICALSEAFVRKVLAEKDVSLPAHVRRSDESAPIAPSHLSHLQPKIDAIFNSGGEAKIIERAGEEPFVQDVVKTFDEPPSSGDKVAEGVNPDPEKIEEVETAFAEPADPSKPWAEFEVDVRKVMAELRAAASRLRDVLKYDPATKQITSPWAKYYSYSGTVGAINQLVREVENGLPCEATKSTAHGYINRQQKEIMSRVIPGSAA